MTHSNQSESENRVLPFRPRGSLLTRNAPRPPAVPDLQKYERIPQEPDDYRHRMMMNVIAVVIVSLLISAGVWIADTIAAMQKAQDCALQGRQNCAPIEVPVVKK